MHVISIHESVGICGNLTPKTNRKPQRSNDELKYISNNFD